MNKDNNSYSNLPKIYLFKKIYRYIYNNKLNPSIPFYVSIQRKPFDRNSIFLAGKITIRNEN